MSEFSGPSAGGQTDDRLAAIAAAAHRSNLDRVDRLREAVEADLAAGLDGDARSAAADVAHKLAGSAGTFGYPQVTDLARQLERHFESGSESGADQLRGWLSEIDAALAGPREED